MRFHCQNASVLGIDEDENWQRRPTPGQNWIYPCHAGCNKTRRPEFISLVSGYCALIMCLSFFRLPIPRTHTRLDVSLPLRRGENLLAHGRGAALADLGLL